LPSNIECTINPIGLTLYERLPVAVP